MNNIKKMDDIKKILYNETILNIQQKKYIKKITNQIKTTDVNYEDTYTITDVLVLNISNHRISINNILIDTRDIEDTSTNKLNIIFYKTFLSISNIEYDIDIMYKDIKELVLC